MQLAYDPLGRLAWTTGSPNFTSFLYDPGSESGAGGDDLVAEYDYGGNVTGRYVHGPGSDEPWLWYHGAAVDHASLRLPFADAQGSIVAVSTYPGQMLSINRYDEYGIPGAGNSGRFQYTGQAWLGELGMYHYRARAYSPTLGRFMQTDPIGYGDGMNIYAYVRNDPLNFTDPSGTLCIAENWVMHIYDARGNDLGPDPVDPEAGTNFIGDCDFLSVRTISRSGGGGASGPVARAARPRNCGRSAPNSSFRLQDHRARVGSFGYDVVRLSAGITQLRVVAVGSAPTVMGPVATPLDFAGSVTLQFSGSNRIPIDIIDSRDVFVARTPIATFTPLAVPAGSRVVFVIGTNTTPNRTIVSIYGC